MGGREPLPRTRRYGIMNFGAALSTYEYEVLAQRAAIRALLTRERNALAAALLAASRALRGVNGLVSL